MELAMAKHVLQLQFLLLLIITAFQPSFVHSEPARLESTLTQDQQPLSAPIQPGDNEICNVQQDLIYNLDQLSLYVKTDCQVNSMALGCQCDTPPPPPKNKCANRCHPHRICCAQRVTGLVAELKN